MKAKLRQYKFNSEGKKLSYIEKYPISHKYQIKERIDILRQIDFTQEEIKNVLLGNINPMVNRINKEIREKNIDLNIKGDIKLFINVLYNVLGNECINILVIGFLNKKYNYSLGYSVKPKEDDKKSLGLFQFAEDNQEYRNLYN